MHIQNNPDPSNFSFQKVEGEKKLVVKNSLNEQVGIIALHNTPIHRGAIKIQPLNEKNVYIKQADFNAVINQHKAEISQKFIQLKEVNACKNIINNSKATNEEKELFDVLLAEAEKKFVDAKSPDERNGIKLNLGYIADYFNKDTQNVTSRHNPDKWAPASTWVNCKSALNKILGPENKNLESLSNAIRGLKESFTPVKPSSNLNINNN
jgi:hypothetical protein